ncbi:MAG: hypothetical protein EU544_01010 [Promethearchaeota archaeon]|nr:MAG: hypothetical protein EU544_01010 [Candidatus Lokiarchaeota archaeon]
MDLRSKLSEIKTFLGISDENFNLEEVLDSQFDSKEEKVEVLGKVLSFIYNFQMFSKIKPFMSSVYICVKNTLEINLISVEDLDELLLKNAILRFVQEYIDYAQISQKEKVLNFLADSFERLGVQPLIINLGLLLKPMYDDQKYLDKKQELREVEVVISDDEISSTIKLNINDWLETQRIDLDRQEELKESLLERYDNLVEEHNLSKDSKTYQSLKTEIIEMLSMRLTMLSLMESVSDDLEPISIK